MPAFTDVKNDSYHYERGNPRSFSIRGASKEQLAQWFPLVRMIEVSLRNDMGPTKTTQAVHWLLQMLVAASSSKGDIMAKVREAKRLKAAAEKSAESVEKEPEPLPDVVPSAVTGTALEETY